jgi:hypothetical protein
MRLSWYADTGVAVFSIWQGGRCTGTFRLPIDDLGRMIEILQRGPQDSRRHGPAGRRSGADDRFGGPRHGSGDQHGADEDATQFSFEAVPDGWPAGQRGAPGLPPDRAGRDAGYDREGYQPEGYQTGGYEPGVLPYEGDGYDSGGYGAAGRETGGYGYETGGRERPGTGSSAGGATGDYGREAYADSEFAAGGRWPEDSGYQGDVTGQHRYSEPGSEGSVPGRFVPPYVRSQDGYPDANPAGRSDRAGHFDAGAYPDSGRTASPAAEDYPQSRRPAGGYFDRPDYLLTADPAVPRRHSGGRHASSDASASGQVRQPEPDIPAAGDPGPGPDYRGRTWT